MAALAASVLPIAYILRGVRRGRLTDWHVTVRDQRRLPLTVCLLSTLAGTAALYLLGAPRQLIALIAAMAASLAVVAAITLALRWKVSVHALVAAGLVGVGWVVYGPVAGALLTPVPAAVAWSRLALRDHSGWQVLAGTAIGLAACLGLFPALV